MLNTTVNLILAVVLASPTPAVQSQDCDVSGTAQDPGGRPVSGAAVTVVAAPASAVTDTEGHFCLTDLGAGHYQLVIFADGYGVAEAAVRVGDGAPSTTDVFLRPVFGEETVVTATRTEKRLAEVPVNVRIIDREQIERVAARTFADAVEWGSGIRIESNCQNCNTSQLRLLGLEGPYSQILVDSQPTVSSLALVYGLEQIPARLIESVEVVKGGGSAVYGAGAVAGVLNVLPHIASHTHIELDSRYLGIRGSDGYSLSAVGDWSVEGRGITGFAQFDRVAPHDRDGDGFTEVTRRELEALGFRYDEFLLQDQARLSVDGNRTSEDRRGGDARLFLPPEETFVTEEILSRRSGGSVSWMHSLSPKYDYRVVGSVAVTDRDSYYGAGFDPNAYGSTENPVWVLDSQFNRYGANASLTWGAQYHSDRIADAQPGYGRFLTESNSDLGLYLQDDRRVAGGLSLLYGLRYDRHSALSSPIASPRLAMMYSPRSDLTLRLSLGTGFRPPVTFDEDLHIVLVGGGEAQVIRNAPDLEEETSRSGLISLEWRPTLGRRASASFELNAFRTELSDLFNTDEQSDDPATAQIELTRTNFGSARVEGAELTLGLRWGSKASFDLSFVQQRARFEHPEPDFGSRSFFRTPERYGAASFQWSAPRVADFFAGLLYTGTMTAPHYAGFVEEDVLETTPSFVQLDVSITRRFSLAADGHRRLGVTLAVKNLTDQFQPDLDRGPDRDPSYVYGPRFPRTVSLGLSLEI